MCELFGERRNCCTGANALRRHRRVCCRSTARPFLPSSSLGAPSGRADRGGTPHHRDARHRRVEHTHPRGAGRPQQRSHLVSEQFHLALPKDGSARLSSCILKTRNFVLRCLREGQDAGEFRTDVEASALAVVVMGTIQMLALSTSNPRPPAQLQAVRDGLATLLRPPTSSRSKSGVGSP